MMGQNTENTVVIYPGPPGLTSADDYTVDVNGQVLFVYEARVNFSRVPDKDQVSELTPFAYFDFSGSVTVTVTTTREIKSVDLRPKSYGIVPKVNGNIIRFTLTEPRKITLELNGDLHRALHLFANPLECDVPDPDDPRVLYFGPGVHEAGTITLQCDQTVYLAGGAYVYGTIRGSGASNASIRGRGIISGQHETWYTAGIVADQCHSLNLRDIIIVDPAGWTVTIKDSDHVTVDNIKLLCSRKNSDGINLVSTRHAVVNDCFVRNWDDGICLKGMNGGDSHHTRVTRCVIWSDAAQSLELGYETQMAVLDDVLFQDIDIIHHLMPGYLALTVHNGDRATITNVLFEDIRVEDSVSALADVWIGDSQWMKDAERGYIRGVHFKNVSLLGRDWLTDPSIRTQPDVALSPLASRTSRLQGYDASHRVEAVTFENVHILGQFIGGVDEGGIHLGEHVGRVQFIPPSDGSPVASFLASTGAGAPPPVSIRFDASASRGQLDDIRTYLWAFGDGATATGLRATHTYTSQGNYLVELTVTDDAGRIGKSARFITILPAREANAGGPLLNGLGYQYYEGDFDPHTDFGQVAPVSEGICRNLDISSRKRDHSFGFVYTGYFHAPMDGVYRFKAGVAYAAAYAMVAGAALYIGDRDVSANNSGWGQIGLKAGYHPLRVTLFTKSADTRWEVKVAGPGIAEQPIPDEILFRSADDNR